MNEIEFAESLWSLINSAMNDGPEMVAHTATSFADDTLIENCEQYAGKRELRKRAAEFDAAADDAEADDTLIENCEQYGHLDEQRLEFTTRRGDVFLVTVERVRAGEIGRAHV